MAETVHRPTLQPVEVALAVMVGQPHALTFGEDQRRTVGDVEQRVGVVLVEGLVHGFRLVHGLASMGMGRPVSGGREVGLGGERVGKELKLSQREADRLEYEGEENEKDMKSSKKQIKKEIEERERLVAESADLRKNVEDYANLKRDKREKMKQL